MLSMNICTWCITIRPIKVGLSRVQVVSLAKLAVPRQSIRILSSLFMS